MEINEIQTDARFHGIPIIRTKSHEILEEITKNANPKHILEIGTAVGYSGITMLSVCDGNLITIEHNKSFIYRARKNFKNYGLDKRVKIIDGDCHVEIAKLVADEKYNGYFDMIFLDGPKAQYSLLFEGLMILLSKGGTFVADNVLFRGYVDGKTKQPTKRYKTIVKRLEDFINKCKNSPEITDFRLIDVEDGIIYEKKR